MLKLKKACNVLLKFFSEILGIQIDEPTDHMPDLSFSAPTDSEPNKVRTSSSTRVIFLTYVRLFVPETSTLDGVSGDNIQRSRDNIKGIWGTYPPKVTTRADGR